MATSLLSPGVFVEEVPSQVKAIAGVSTSVAGFIGIIPTGTVQLVAKNPDFDPTDDASLAFKFVDHAIPATEKVPVLVSSWAQFTRSFGDLVGDSTLDATTVPNAKVDPGYQQLAHAVYGFFNNGGSRCYVTRVAGVADLDAALTAFAAIDEIALVCAPGQTDDAVYGKLVDHCEATGDRFAILDGPQFQAQIDLLTKPKPQGGVAPARTDLAAFYYPWVRVFDPGTQLVDAAKGGSIAVPPSGHVAGIYARVDTQRGVFKSPANEVVRGALDVTHGLSRADQDTLNPKGVNAIRSLNGNILVWGARTVGGDANADLKYISVRRTLLFLRESIEEGMQWTVFEPNTPALWAKISRNITAFLTTVWRSGALFGNTPQEAFFVKCDAENNPPESRDQGQVVTDIGVAIARPAEFVIFRISQSSAATK
ncbi:MAG TPA: phage tail sheath subtilisin-like domain-containing protein [Gemmatimonadaceae bacterium]|nr:phage tail sheath subtilisin-like domain-containing protein [Gemmatimonadaceae bacterium]